MLSTAGIFCPQPQVSEGNYSLSDDQGKITAIFSDNTLQVTTTGNFCAKLIRDGKIINLSSKPEVKGLIKNGDVLILISLSFLEILNLKPLLNKHSPNASDYRNILLNQIEGQPVKDQNKAVIVVYSENKSQPIDLPIFEPTVNFPPPNKKRLSYLAVVFILVFMCTVIFQLRNRGLENQTQQVQKIESQTKLDLEAANKLVGINDNIAKNDLLKIKQNFLNLVESSFGQNWQKENPVLNATFTKINESLIAVSHIYNVNPELYYDFSLLRANPNISQISLVNNVIFALDSGNGSVYTLGTKNKNTEIVGGDEKLKAAKSLDSTGKIAYIFTPSGIMVTRNGVKTSILPSDKWGEIIGLRTFAGNIYLLDKSNVMIWKYQGTDLGFEELSPYLRAASVNFSNVVDFAIDGYIWTLSSTGTIVKFSSGIPESFDFVGLETPLSNASKIFVTDETQNIYVLSNENKRVTVFDKKANYKAQYNLPQSVQNLAVDESIKKIFIFTPTQVFSFELK